MEAITLMISLCPNCQNIVKAAGKKDMNEASKAEFFAEVFKHNLQVQFQSLEDYRKQKNEFCQCK